MYHVPSMKYGFQTSFHHETAVVCGLLTKMTFDRGSYPSLKTHTSPTLAQPVKDRKLLHYLGKCTWQYKPGAAPQWP